MGTKPSSLNNQPPTPPQRTVSFSRVMGRVESNFKLTEKIDNSLNNKVSNITKSNRIRTAFINKDSYCMEAEQQHKKDKLESGEKYQNLTLTNCESATRIRNSLENISVPSWYKKYEN